MAKNNTTMNIVYNFDGNFKATANSISQINKALDNIKLPEATLNKLKNKLKDIESTQQKLQKRAEQGFGSQKEVENYTKDITKAQNQINSFVKDINNIDLSKVTKGIYQQSEAWNKLRIEADTAGQKTREAKAALEEAWSGKEFKINYKEPPKNKRVSELAEQINTSVLPEIKQKALSANIGEKEFSNFVEQQWKAIAHGETVDLSGLRAKFNKIIKEMLADATPALQAESKSNIATKNQKTYESETIKQVKGQTNVVTENSKSINENYNAINKQNQALSQNYQTYQNIQNKIGSVTSRLAYLTSGYYLFQKAIQVVNKSFQEFYELDKIFNEISVVTGQSMTDMWNGFSKVNKIAQQYGTTTKDVVEVQNLFYHQGLSNAEVNRLTAETLTLAKISGLDYADATNKMTAAMNAFNIESKNAGVITDTYAALAANAATDVSELANAMTKTASIAANAGMDIQSTSVFLTKMINFAIYSWVA